MTCFHPISLWTSGNPALTSKKACKELFVFLCGVGGLDDDSMQINYECLSLIQIFLKQEEEGGESK